MASTHSTSTLAFKTGFERPCPGRKALRLTSGRPNSHLMERNIRQIGEAIVDVSTPFELPPDFPNLRLQSVAAANALKGDTA